MLAVVDHFGQDGCPRRIAVWQLHEDVTKLGVTTPGESGDVGPSLSRRGGTLFVAHGSY